MTYQESQNGKDVFFDAELEAEIANAGGPFESVADTDGRVGVTMFDVSGSEDNLVAVVVPKHRLKNLPAQALVKIDSTEDKRVYQGIVVKGPLYEPDGIRADSAVIVTTASNGVMFMPKYHGRVWVEILGELINDALIPPRYRPLPNSPVYPLTPEESRTVLNLGGDITLGRAIGHEDMEVKIPVKKSVLARHLAVLGTTGGGKSTTISGLVDDFQENELATVLIDTEGEYTGMFMPTDHKDMKNALAQRKQQPHGVENVTVYCLAGREPFNAELLEDRLKYFSLRFENISPYALMEILQFNEEAQQPRYLQAYDAARVMLSRMEIFPKKNDQEDLKAQLEHDDLQKGYPRLTLAMMYDVVRAFAEKANKSLIDESGNLNFRLQSDEFRNKQSEFIQVINQSDASHVGSWRKVQGKLGQLLRLKIFDNTSEGVEFLNYDSLTQPGQVAVFDLSDVDTPQIRNLAIAELLRGLMESQNDSYKKAMADGQEQDRKVMILIEEAHEFLSDTSKMRTLYEQVARIAKRGRKRWLGLGFITQLPQHLPDEVLALVNNFILHKISDANVVARLKRTVGNVDEGLWNKMKNLSAGQAVVSLSHMRRGMLVAVDPTPCKLLLIDKLARQLKLELAGRIIST